MKRLGVLAVVLIMFATLTTGCGNGGSDAGTSADAINSGEYWGGIDSNGEEIYWHFVDDENLSGYDEEWGSWNMRYRFVDDDEVRYMEMHVGRWERASSIEVSGNKMVVDNFLADRIIEFERMNRQDFEAAVERFIN